MKRHCHHSISGVKSLLNSITMVNIYVNIQHTPVNFEEFEDTKNNVVDVAESRGLRLLRMMESTGPINSDVSIGAVKFDGGADGAAGGGLAEVKQAVKDGAILADVEALEMAGEGGVSESVRRDRSEKVNVVIGMEAANVGGGGRKGTVDLHAAVERVVYDEVVRHADTVGLHWVALTVVVITDGRFVEVCYSSLLSVTAW